MSDFYDFEFGMPAVINGIGTMTSLGGSRMDERVTRAMVQSSKCFVDINKLHRKAGRRIVELCKAPDGYTAYVTTGAAAGLSLSVAACMTETDQSSVSCLPNTDHISKKLVLLDRGSDMRWNQSIQTSGAQLLFVGSTDHPATYNDLQCILNEKSCDIACMVYFAGMYYKDRSLPFKDVRELTDYYKVRLVVDAAAELPPRSNLWRWTTDGVDIVLFSGGKGVGGPQTSGILLGKADLVACVAVNGSPHELTVGRPMKTSKESICGLVRALEIFVQGSDADDEAHYKSVISIIFNIIRGTVGISGLYVVSHQPPPSIQPNTIPKLHVDLAVKQTPLFLSGNSSMADFYGNDLDHGDPLAVQPTTPINTLAYKLLQFQPPVAVNTSDTGIVINPQTLTTEEAEIVGQAVKRSVNQMVEEGILETRIIVSKL